jgi:hypothetical protein
VSRIAARANGEMKWEVTSLRLGSNGGPRPNLPEDFEAIIAKDKGRKRGDHAPFRLLAIFTSSLLPGHGVT